GRRGGGGVGAGRAAGAPRPAGVSEPGGLPSPPPPPPPIPPISGAAVSHEDLVLRAADGNEFASFEATPDGDASNAGIVILPDVRGLYRFYEELALRFAERGYYAVAIDYFRPTPPLPNPPHHFHSMH